MYKLVKCTTTCSTYIYVLTYLLAIFYFKALLALQVFVTLVVHYNGRHLVMGIVVYVRTLHALVMMC